MGKCFHQSHDPALLPRLFYCPCPFQSLICHSSFCYSALPPCTVFLFLPLHQTLTSSRSLLPPPPSLPLSRSLSLALPPSLRFSEMKQELAEEGSRCSILSKQHRFNEHCCIRCCAPFTFLLNPKRQCLDCQYNVCKTCCTYSKKDKAWLCSACQKGR